MDGVTLGLIFFQQRKFFVILIQRHRRKIGSREGEGIIIILSYENRDPFLISWRRNYSTSFSLPSSLSPSFLISKLLWTLEGWRERAETWANYMKEAVKKRFCSLAPTFFSLSLYQCFGFSKRIIIMEKKCCWMKGVSWILEGTREDKTWEGGKSGWKKAWATVQSL